EADEPLRGSLHQLGALFEAAQKTAGDPKSPSPERVAALRLLGRGFENRQDDLAVLAGLLNPQTEEQIELAAIAALARTHDLPAVEAMLGAWPGYTPNTRFAVLDALLSRSDGPAAILQALGERRILPQDVPLPL